MTYTATHIEGNLYQIETVFAGEKIKFNVCVAESETEIEDLVQFHLNSLSNPNTPKQNIQESQPDLAAIVSEQQTVIEQLKADIETLKRNS